MAQLDISNGVLDVTSTQGKTWGPIEVTVTDSAGAPVAPTAAAWVIRDGYGGAAVLTAGTANWLTLGTASITLNVPGTATAAVAAGQYVHELEWTAGGAVDGIGGTWIVGPEAVK